MAVYFAGLSESELADFTDLIMRSGKTVDLVVELNRVVNAHTRYVIREEPGVWTPEETLRNGRGSCRDSAVLLVAALGAETDRSGKPGVSRAKVDAFFDALDNPVPGQRVGSLAVLRDLRAEHCDMVTIGQYLQPTRQHVPVAHFYDPADFALLKTEALAMGFVHVESSPLTRSSYHAGQHSTP